MNRRIAANLAVFVTVFLVMCVWAVRQVVTFDFIERPYELDVDLAAASGIAPDSEVAYLGVHFGRVGDIDLVEGGVRATLKIDRERQIPRGSIARVFRKSAIGEPYIDFQPPEGFDPRSADDDDYYRAGDVVPVEDTRTPIEFSELLRTASALISSIDPDRAGTLLHELALGLDGRGEDLRRLTAASDTLATTFAERTEVLDRLTVNNARLTAVMAAHRTSLGQSLSDLAAVGESLRNAAGDTRVLLERGSTLLAQVADLIDGARPDLDCILADLVLVNERAAEPERLAGLAHHLDVGPNAYGLLLQTRDIEPDGPWVRVHLTFGPEDASNQYNPPLALPTVPVVPACGAVEGRAATGAAQPVQAAPAAATRAADFRPSDVLGDAGSRGLPLSRGGGGVAASAAVAALGSAGVVAVRRWRAR